MAATPAAAFDARVEQLESAGLARMAPAGRIVAIAELRDMVPAGDTRRALRVRALHCDWAFDEDPRAQLRFATDALADARAAGDRAAESRLHYCRATAIEALGGDGDDAMAEYDAGIAAARKAGELRLVADGLGLRGATYSLLGDQARAIPDLLAAIRIYRDGGYRDDADALLLDIGISYRRMGEFAKARDYFRKSEAIALARDDWSTMVGILLQRGYLAEDDGRPADAMAVYRQALALAERHDSAYDLASVRLAMAWPAILDDDYREALQLLDRAEAGFAALGDRSNADMLALRRGQAHAGLGRHALALSHYARAAAAMERSGNQRYLAMLYLARARSLRALGRDREAYADLQRFIDVQAGIAAAERSQQAQLLRNQFESDRRDLETSRLESESALRQRQLDALLQARRWQWTAMALGGVLVVVLLGLVARQVARMRRLRELAATDPLTGVANRRSIERLGEEAIAEARRHGEPLCVLILDIDHFKRVNDRYGHLTGDEALARVATACGAALRQFDQLGRIGGEEFLVLLPRTELAQARQVAERIRATVEALDFAGIDPDLRLSISIGVAELREGDPNLRALAERADAALYAAKDAGRNRLVAAA